MTGCKYYCKLVSGFSNTNCKLFLGRDTDFKCSEKVSNEAQNRHFCQTDVTVAQPPLSSN